MINDKKGSSSVIKLFLKEKNSKVKPDWKYRHRHTKIWNRGRCRKEDMDTLRREIKQQTGKRRR